MMDSHGIWNQENAARQQDGTEQQKNQTPSASGLAPAKNDVKSQQNTGEDDSQSERAPDGQEG